MTSIRVSPRKGESAMVTDFSDDDSVELEDESSSSFKQYKEKHFTLNWLSMREKQIKVAMYYEKYRKSVPFIEDSDLVCKKISELKIELEEANNDKRMKDLMCSQGQVADILQSIVGPKKSETMQSRYSDDQIKCIKELLQKKQTLTKQRKLKQKEILSLEEEMETLKNHNSDLNGKKKYKKGDSSHTNSEEFEKLEKRSRQLSNSRQLACRSHLLAKAIHFLSKHYMSLDHSSKNKKLQHLILGSKYVMRSQLDDIDELHSLFLMIHNLNL